MSDARDQITKVAVVALLGGAVAFGVLEGNGAGRVPRGKSAPEFKVERLTGGDTTLADFKGKVVMVAFWGTWCGPCKEEMPHLVQLADEYKDKGATLLAINDYNEEHENMPQFVDHELPRLKPYAAWGNESVYASYGIEAFPTLYVLDGHGSVVASWQGLAAIERVQAAVDKGLKRN